jgi:TP901 family phage tail tape measure protein
MAIGDAEMQLKMHVAMSLVDTDEMMKDLENQIKPLSTRANMLGKAASVGMVSAAGALAGLAGATIMGVRAVIAFEDAFAGVRKTVDAEEAVIQNLSDQIRNLATEIPIAADELARIGELGGQLGIAAENLESFIEVVAKLGVATVLSTENAALALARLAAIANIPEESLGQFFERTSSALVDLGNNFAATEDEIITTVLRIATAAEQTGASTQDALAFATALQAVGVPAQAGGTAIARVFQEIQRAISAGGEQLNLFARVADLSISEFQTLFAEDAAMAVATFIRGLSEADERGIKLQDTLKKLNLSQRRTQLAIGGLSTAGDLLIDTLVTSRNAFDANIALNIEAAKKFTTTAQQIQLLRNQFKELTMQLGEQLLPFIRDLIFLFQGIIRGLNPEMIKQFAKLTAGFFILSTAVKGMIIMMQMLGTATAAAATGTIGLAAGVSLLGGAITAGAFIASLGLIIGQVKLFTNMIGDAQEIGAGLSLGSLVADAEQYGMGILESVNILEEGLKGQKETFSKVTKGVSFEDVYTAAGADNAEKIANAFKDKGMPVPSDTDIQRYSALFMEMSGINEEIEAAGISMEFLFTKQLEKAMGIGGGLGDVFTNLKNIAEGDTALSGEAKSVLERILLGGEDPQILIGSFLEDVAKAKDLAADEFAKGNKEVYEAVEPLFENADLEALSLVNLAEFAETFKVLETESAEQAAKKVKLAGLQKNLSEEDLALKIAADRQEARAEARRLGMSEDLIAQSEFSADVREAELILEEQMTTAIKERADAIAFEITSREIAMMKVEAIAKKASQSMVSLFEDVPEQVNMTTNEVVRNLQDQAVMGMEFMETIASLQEQGFVGLAAMLAKEGPKALAVAQQFLTDTSMAKEAEGRIAQANTSLLMELQEFTEDMGLTDQEIREKFVEGGGSLIQGIAEGIRTGDTAIREALTETVNKGLEGFEIEFKISSPSEDENVMEAGYEIVRGFAGRVDEGAKYFEDEVVRALGQSAINAAERGATDLGIEMDFVANNPTASQFGFGNNVYIKGLESELLRLENFVQTKTAELTVDYTSARYKAMVESVKDSLTDTFNIYTNFSATLGSITSQTQSIIDAERNLASVREYNLTLIDKQTKATERYENAIKKFGNEGIVTDFERLNLKQEQLSLIRMQRDAAKSGSASERIAIKDAKRELEFLEQAAKRGVATEDEVQAARERLADLTGTTEGIGGFQGKEEYQNMLNLQKEINDLQIKFQKELIEEMKTASKELNDEVLDAEKEKDAVANEIADKARSEQIAQEKVTQAKMQEYQTQLQLFGLADKLIALGPEGESQFRKIASAVGMPEEEINALITQAQTMGNQFATEFDGIATGIAKIQYDAAEGAKLTIEIQDAMAGIDAIKKELNSLYAGVGLPLPFPDIASQTNVMTRVDESLQAYQDQLMSEVNTYLESIGFDPDVGFDIPDIFGNNSGDKDNGVIDKFLYKGGFAPVGTRAMVGELGPEMIRVRPNGVNVTPIMGGGSNGNIYVDSVNVNVTGVPSDPQSARKAAKQIEKALVNLKKEGSSSGILGY